MTNRTGHKRRPHRGQAPKFAPKPVAAPPKRRLRSEHVAYGVIGALVLACCGWAVFDEPDKDCVDPQNMQVIDDSYCRSGGHGRWYYGGYHSGKGSKISGGSWSKGGFGGRFSGGS